MPLLAVFFFLFSLAGMGSPLAAAFRRGLCLF